MAHDRLGASVTNDPHPSFLPPSHAFSFDAFDAPTAVSEPRAEPKEAYVLVRSTGPVDPSECEEPGAEAVEVTVMWGSSVLEVFHLSPPRPFHVGHGDGVDFLLPPELSPLSRTAIVEVEQGLARVVRPEGATLSLRDAPPVVIEGAAGDRELRAGRTFELSFGALTFRLASVARGRRVPRAIGADYRGIGASFACSFGAVAAFLGILAYYTPALGTMLDNELDRDQAARLRPYLTALAEREEKRKEAEGDTGAATPGGGTPGEEAKGPRGAMGRPNTPQTNKRTAVAGTGERVLARDQMLTDARTFGLVGILNSMNSRALPTAMWGADIANGPDASDAWGNLYGEDIGESGGAGGLSLSGTGSGGGARGDWIGLGTGGLCNPTCGTGHGGEGIGRGIGRQGPGHVTKAPRLQAIGETVVGGHLAPELIQRVVRQNFGRFRNCYETGLRTNPNLTGRVTTRFIIDREGAVSTASNGGSDLPDSKVVACVVSAFYGVSFPAPQNGVVRVNYPILFSPG